MSQARKWIPNQHGAWAFLITPVLVGAAVSGPSGWQLLLLIAWLTAYCVNFFVSLAVKSRRPARYRSQLSAYGLATMIIGIPLAWQHPQLLVLLLAALPAFAANLVFVMQRNERMWLNDVIGIALAGVVGYASYLLGPTPTQDSLAVRALMSVCLYFVGTVIYVKSMIRERHNRRWMRLSYLFHSALVVLALLAAAPLLTLVAALLLLRALAIPRLGWTPKRIGLTEIIFTVAVALAALLGWS